MQIHLYDQFQRWLSGGQIYFYSDPHFNDGEMCYLRKNYMSDDDQVASINSRIGKNDTLVILGDVGDVNYIKKIRGHKVLITGNHDAGVSNYQRITKEVPVPCDQYLPLPSNDIVLEAYQLFPNDADKQGEYVDSVYLEAWKKANSALKDTKDFIRLGKKINCSSHGPSQYWVAQYDNKLFDEVYDGPLFISPKLLLSHEPIDYPYAVNIHGHDHSNWFRGDQHFNMCAEHIDYTPVSLKSIVSSGVLKNVQDIHRVTIDRATIKKAARDEEN